MKFVILDFLWWEVRFWIKEINSEKNTKTMDDNFYLLNENDHIYTK